MVHGSHRRLLVVFGLCLVVALLLFVFSTRTDASSVGACSTGQLRLDAVGGQGFTSHREVDFALRNVGTRTCSLRGYPGASWLDRSAHQLSRHVDRASGRAVRTVVLAPFGRAFFSFVYVVAGPCLPHRFIAYGLQFYPPGARRALRWYTGRTAVCAAPAGGNAQVSPVEGTRPS
jgi:hypothetical protein